MAASNPARTALRLLLLIALLTGSAAAQHGKLLATPPAPDAVALATPSADATTIANEAANFQRARHAADTVLQGSEFQTDLMTSWWEQKKNALVRAIGRIFSRVSRLGAAMPWLARALEWLLFGGAALGLLFFVLRELRRQRLQVSLTGSAVKAEVFSREADDWSQRAETFAQQGRWRDAVHCLYWAAIVLLESRRAWRHNPTRTPREYVRLLRTGSPQHAALRELTRIFERTWYGLRETTSAEYTEARALYDNLLTASSSVLKTGRADAAPAPAEGL